MTFSMISTIDLSEGLLTSYFVYLSVEEVVVISINIVHLTLKKKKIDMFQEWYMVHAHCFYPVNQIPFPVPFYCLILQSQAYDLCF